MMEDIQLIIERMERRDLAREEAIKLTREATRLSARAIRQIHRSLDNPSEIEECKNSLRRARELLNEVDNLLKDMPEIYYAGFVEHAQQEFAEAVITFNIIRAFEDGKNVRIPSPEELNVTDASYLGGLADTVGECRRYIISLLIRGETKKAQKVLALCEDIHHILMEFDFPDALTHGLRHKADIASQLIDKTRSDITAAFAAERIEKVVKKVG